MPRKPRQDPETHAVGRPISERDCGHLLQREVVNLPGDSKFRHIPRTVRRQCEKDGGRLRVVEVDQPARGQAQNGVTAEANGTISALLSCAHDDK